MANLKKDVQIVISGKDMTAKAASSATLAMKRLGTAAKAAGIAVAATGAAAAAAFTKIAKDNIAAFDKLAKVSGKIGVSVESLSALAHAAELTGVSQDTLNMALQRFTRRVAEAAKGEGVLSKVMEELGIQLRDSNGEMRATTDILADYADAVQNAESDQERLRLAFKAFDSEGAALVNLLRNGSAGMRQLTNEAAKLGIVIDRSTAAKAEEFNDQLTRIKAAGRGLGITLTSELLPTLTQMADAIVRQVNRFNEWRNSTFSLQKQIRQSVEDMQTVFFGVTETLHDFWDGLRLVYEMVASVGMAIGQLAAIVHNVLLKNIETAVQIFGTWRKYMGDAVQTARLLAFSVVNLGDAMASLAKGDTAGLQQIRNSLVSIGKQFDGLAKSFGTSFKKTSHLVASTFEDDMELAVSGVQNLFADLEARWDVLARDVSKPLFIPSPVQGPAQENQLSGKSFAPSIESETVEPNALNDEILTFQDNIATAQASVESFGATAKQSFGQAASQIANAALNAQNMSDAAKSAGIAIVQTFIDLAIRRTLDGVLMQAQAAAGISAMSGITAANVSAGAATASAWAPAAAAVSLATFGANSVPANAGLISTFGLAQSLSTLGKLSSLVLGQAHDGVVFPRSGSYLMNVQKGEQIIPRTPGPSASMGTSGPLEINLQIGTRTLARGVMDAVRGGTLNLKVSNTQKVVTA